MDILRAPQSMLSFQRKPHGDECFFPDEEDSYDLPLVSASDELSNDGIENTSKSSRGLFQRYKIGLGELRESIHSAMSLEGTSTYCSEGDDSSSSEESSLKSFGDDDASIINFDFPLEDQNSTEMERRGTKVVQHTPSTLARNTSNNGEMSQYEGNVGLQLTFDSAGSCRVRPLTFDSADSCQVRPLVESVVVDKANKIGHGSVLSFNQKTSPRYDPRTSEKTRDASSIQETKTSGRHSRCLRRTHSAGGKFSQIHQGSSRNTSLVKPVYSTAPDGRRSQRRIATSSNDSCDNTTQSCSQSNGLDDKNRSQRSKSTKIFSMGIRRVSSAEGNNLQRGSSELTLPTHEDTEIAPFDVVDPPVLFPNKDRPVGSTRTPTSLACGAKRPPPIVINSTTQKPNANTHVGWVQKNGILVSNRQSSTRSLATAPDGFGSFSMRPQRFRSGKGRCEG